MVTNVKDLHQPYITLTAIAGLAGKGTKAMTQFPTPSSNKEMKSLRVDGSL